MSTIFEPFGGVDSDWQMLAIVSALRVCFNELEIAYRPCKQISAHDWSLLELDDFQTLLARSNRLLRHVAQCCQIVRDFDTEIECGFEIRLVKTGKGAPGIAGFELRAEHYVLISCHRRGLRGRCCSLIQRSIESGHVVIDRSAEVDVKNMGAGSNIFQKLDLCTLLFLVIVDESCFVTTDLGRLQLQLSGIKCDFPNWRSDLDVNSDCPLVAEIATKLQIE